jgi:hypothetical protein
MNNNIVVILLAESLIAELISIIAHCEDRPILCCMILHSELPFTEWKPHWQFLIWYTKGPLDFKEGLWPTSSSLQLGQELEEELNKYFKWIKIFI